MTHDHHTRQADPDTAGLDHCLETAGEEEGRVMFVHYSTAHLSRVYDCDQNVRIEKGDKPHGLWFSVEGNDDGWREWCVGDGFALNSLSHPTEIIFSETANLLRLESAEDIDRFTATFGHVPEWVSSMPAGYYPAHLSKGTAINWKAVAEKYDGIIIAPYVWSRRLCPDCHWYYTWDCACGVVWNACVTRALRPLPIIRHDETMTAPTETKSTRTA